jgi:hypothetical protein
MWTVLLGTSLAALFEGVDVDDPGPWQDRAAALLQGPPGCWEVVGKASYQWSYGRFGLRQGEAGFAARFEDGTWSDLLVRSLGQVDADRDGASRTYPHGEVPFAPAVGRARPMRVSAGWSAGGGTTLDVRPDGEQAPRNQIESLIDEIAGRVETAWSSWDVARDGVVLQRLVPIGDKAGAPEVRQTVFFPGGATLPTEIDLLASGRIDLGGASLNDVEVHVRGKVHGGRLFPTAEAQVFRASALLGLFTLESRRTVTYTSWRACPVPPPAAPPPAPVPEPAPEPTPVPEPEGPRVIEFEGGRRPRRRRERSRRPVRSGP